MHVPSEGTWIIPFLKMTARGRVQARIEFPRRLKFEFAEDGEGDEGEDDESSDCGSDDEDCLGVATRGSGSRILR